MIFWGKFSLNKQFFKFLYGHEIFFFKFKKISIKWYRWLYISINPAIEY